MHQKKHVEDASENLIEASDDLKEATIDANEEAKKKTTWVGKSLKMKQCNDSH